MAFFKKSEVDARFARNHMEEAAKYTQNKEDFQAKLLEQTGDEKFAKTYRNRGKLYDKLKVSLRTMDIIIYVIVALIVIALVVGVAIGN